MANLMRKTKEELVEMIDEKDAIIADLEEQIVDRDARLKEWTDDPVAPMTAGTMIEIEVLNPARLLAFGALMAGFVAALCIFGQTR